VLVRMCRNWNPHTVGGNVKWCIHCGKQFGSSSKTYTIYDTAIPLLEICPREIKTYIHTKTSMQMFIMALFITAKLKTIQIIYQLVNGLTKWGASIQKNTIQQQRVMT